MATDPGVGCRQDVGEEASSLGTQRVITGAHLGLTSAHRQQPLKVLWGRGEINFRFNEPKCLGKYVVGYTDLELRN